MLISEPCLDLLQALLAARLAFPTILRTCEAWSPKSKKTYLYADLNTIIDATTPVLGAHGLLMVQSPEDGAAGMLRVSTRIYHVVTGQWIGTEVSFERPSNPQDAGIVITYMKRYTMAALLNLSSDEDDDASSFSGVHKAEKPAAAENGRPNVPVTGNGHTPTPLPPEGSEDASLTHPTMAHLEALKSLACVTCGEDEDVLKDRIRRCLGLKAQASVAFGLMARVMTMRQYMSLYEYFVNLESQLAKSKKEAPDGAESSPPQAPAPPPAAASPEAVPQDPPEAGAVPPDLPAASSSAASAPEDTVETLVQYAVALGLKEDVTRRVIHLHKDLKRCRTILTDAAERNRRQVA